MNLYHYAMGVPLTSSIDTDFPDLVPRVDGAFFDGRASLFFSIPEDPVDDINFEVEESFDMETWTVVATKEGADDWTFSFPTLVIPETPKDGRQGVLVAASKTYSQQKLAYYRLKVRLK